MVQNAFQQTTVQLNKCEIGPYFLQNFQCKTMFTSVFCKSCEPMLCEPEIVQAKPTDISCKVFKQFQVHTTWVHNSYKTQK